MIETNHNGLILEIEIEFSSRKPERQEMFNFRNKKCQEIFQMETEVNAELLKCLETDLPFEVQAKN